MTTEIKNMKALTLRDIPQDIVDTYKAMVEYPFPDNNDESIRNYRENIIPPLRMKFETAINAHAYTSNIDTIIEILSEEYGSTF